MAPAMPAPFAHQESITAAKLNALGSVLTDLQGRTPGRTLNFAQENRYADNDAERYIWHTHRFLHFRNDGEIRDPFGVYEPISLSPDSETFGTIKDLDDTWIGYGQPYIVEGCEYAIEWSEEL